MVKLFGYEKYPEMSIQRILQFAEAEIEDIHVYLPDDLEPASIERTYFLDLVNSLRPNSVEQIRRGAITRSNQGAQNEEDGERRIVLSQQFQNIFGNRLLPLGNRL